MGSAQSYLSSELVGTALTGLVIAGAVGISFTRLGSSSTRGKTDQRTSADSAIKKGKKKKQNKSPAGEATFGVTPTGPPPPQLVHLPDTIPGQFDVNPHPLNQDSSAAEILIPKAKKPKRKKNKNTEDTAKNLTIPSDYHSESSSVQKVPKSRDTTKRSSQPRTPEVTPGPEISSRTLPIGTSSLDTDSSWTQVGSKRSRKSSILRPSGESQSEASFTTTTSQKDESSPRNTAEDDSHDSFLLQQSTLPSSSWASQNRTTVPEKLLPNPQKTGVEDMLETPDDPSPSRVIRVAPLPSERPVAGFTWADYEDVRVATDGGENDADGEDDGWGVVSSKRPRRLNISSSSTGSHSSLRASETLTKRQRQNAQKREQQKAAKVEAESQRLATLAGHKRALEKVRMEEHFGKASGSKASGGMKASVDERGKLIWE